MTSPEFDHSICATADEMLDAAVRSIAELVQFVVGPVFDPDGRDPIFIYTIGNYGVGLPELIAIGISKVGVLYEAGHIQRGRGKAFEHGEIVSLGGRLPVKFVDATVRAKADYTHQVGNFYGTDDYQVRQLVYCDSDGRFPGDPDCAEPYASQPVLTALQ